LATILKREADDSYEAVEQLRSGPIAMPRDREWNQFVEHDPHFVNPKLPLRKVHEIEYPSKNHPAASEVRAGMLERKSKYLKSYTPGWQVLSHLQTKQHLTSSTRYVLSPTHLHEFKSADRIYSQPPVMSLFLPDQKLGSHSEAGSTSHKFSLKGRQAGGMHRGHSWVFRAESHDTMLAWFTDIKALTEKTGEERNAFVRRSHARSVSGTSAKSVSSGSGIDEDEEDEAPYSAPPAIKVSTPEPAPQRPQPGGRFPSDLQINRHLQAPPSASSEGSDPGNRNEDLSTTGGGLQGAALPKGPTREHQAVQREPSQRSLSRDNRADETPDEGNPAHNVFVALPEPSREPQREAPQELPTSATPAAAAAHRDPTPSYFHRHDESSQAASSKPPDQERKTERDDTRSMQAPESQSIHTAPAANNSLAETYPTQQYQSQEYLTQVSNEAPAQQQPFLGRTQPEITGQAGPLSQPSPVRQNSSYGDWMAPAAAGVGGVAAGAVGAEAYRRHQAADEEPKRLSEEKDMRPQQYQGEQVHESEQERFSADAPLVAPLYLSQKQTTKPESVQEQDGEPKEDVSPARTPPVAPFYMREQQKDQQEYQQERESMSEEKPLTTDTSYEAPLSTDQQYWGQAPVNPASLDISSAGFTPVGASDVTARQQEAGSYESPPTDAMLSTAGGLAMVQQKRDEPSFEPVTGSPTSPATTPFVEPQHQDDEIPPERASPGGVAEPLLPPVDADPEEQHEDPPYPTSGVMATEMPTGPMQVPFSPAEPSPAETPILDSVYNAPSDSFVPPASFMQAPYSPTALSQAEPPVMSSLQSPPSDAFVAPPSFMQAPYSPAERSSPELPILHSPQISPPRDCSLEPTDSNYEQTRAPSDDLSPAPPPGPAVYDEPRTVDDEPSAMDDKPNTVDEDPQPQTRSSLSSSTTAFLGTISSPSRSFAEDKTGGPTQMRETGRIFPAVLRHNTDMSVSQLHIPGEYPKTPMDEFKGY